MTSRTLGSPLVSVPVLSKTIVSIFCRFSKAGASLNNIPRFAPTPVATIIATGVAKPNAHGQEITKTAIAVDKAKETPLPNKSHTTAAIRAIMITVGTKTAAILSARRAIGALDAEACSTICTIFAKTVSSATLTARHFKYPPVQIEAVNTSSFTLTSTGRLSPVNADLSKLAAPSMTIPSAGIFSPARTRKMSSFCKSFASMVYSTPSRKTFA